MIAGSSVLAVPLGRAKERPAWLKALRQVGKNKLVLTGVALAVTLILVALFANFIAPYDPLAMQVTDALQAPTWQHPFGSDRFGRDILTRTIYGGRLSLWVGLVSVSVSLVAGTTLGLISGYYGGWIDNLISRIMDILFSFPALLLAITIAATLGPGLNNAIIAIAVVYSPPLSRIVRGSVIAVRNREYIESARVIGSSNQRIIGRHILPNVLSPIIVQVSITISHAILLESYLSYLGLGVQPPEPSWGTMLNEGRSFLELAPWTSVFPGLAIVLSVFAFNLLGDGLRDLLDPRARSA